MSSELNYLSTCACVDAMDRIASKTYLRLSYEYGICPGYLRAQPVPCRPADSNPAPRTGRPCR